MLTTDTRSRAHRPRRRTRTAPQPDPVLRVYEVTLMVDAETVHEPVRITLSYTDAEASALDPMSPKAKNEAFRRAVKVERRTHQTPEWRQFFINDVRLVRQCLIDPARRSNPPRRSTPARRSALAAA